MGWFHIYLSWILVYVSAVSVSCQQLTTVLPEDDDACMRNEVTFNCTVRGLRNLTSLVLAWSSNEYIGEGNILRFLSIDTPDTSKTSMINGNVIATLKSNTAIDGVPELVSVLRVVGANRSSVITCESVTNGSSASTEFVSSAYPGRPQSGEARERSAGSCEVRVTWNPPNNINRFDIDRYIIYIPSRNIRNVSFSTTIDLTIPNCRDGDNSIILVAAMNRLGCVGPNSSPIRPNLDMPTIQMQDDGISRTAIIIAIVACISIIIAIVLATIGILLCVRYCPKGKSAKKVQTEHTTELESMKEQFEFDLKYLYEALKTDSLTSMRDAIRVLLKLEKRLSPSNIQEALKNVLGTEKPSAGGLRLVLGRLKKRIPHVMKNFETQLMEVGSSINMDNLIEEAQKGKHKTLFEELKDKVGKASPVDVQNLLRTLFEELQNAIKQEQENNLQEVFFKLEETYMNCKLPLTEIEEILQVTINNLQKDTSASDSDDELLNLDVSTARDGGVNATRESHF